MMETKLTEWIKCCEKLPPEHRFYQTYHESGSVRMDCCFDTDLQRFEEESPMGWFVEPKSKVTHWMPLPEPPKLSD